jgi:DNA polymerase-4
VPHREPKSIGHETTFEEDIDDPARVRKTLLSLSDAVAVRLRKHDLEGKTVTLKFRDESFVTETRAHTPPIRSRTELDLEAAMASSIASGGRKKDPSSRGERFEPSKRRGAQLSLFDRPRRS